MDYKQQILLFEPMDEEEKLEKESIVSFISKNDDCLLRSNKIAHLTSSSIILNPSLTKMLMIYHNIYENWGWTGGHMDGDSDLEYVAIKEAMEETGIKNPKLFSHKIYSLATLPVKSHYKHGKYVLSHLHMNATFVLIASEDEIVRPKLDENSGVKWVLIEDIAKNTDEKEVLKIYLNVIRRCQDEAKNSK